MTLHPALQHCHILPLICEELDPDYDSFTSLYGGDVKSSGDLLSMALACTTFTEHALDVLWRGICLQPVLSLLGAEKVDGKMTFPGAIAPERWSHAEKYLRRVRAVHIQTHNIADIHHSTFPHLLKLGRAIFPCIRVLKMDHMFASSANALIFLSPTISNFQLSDCDSRENFRPQDSEAALATLFSRVPDLEKLYIDGQAIKSPPDMLLSFKNLRTLVIENTDDLGFEFVKSLATLNRLTDLDIRLLTPPPFQPRREHVLRGFRSLERLILWAEIPLMTQILRLVGGPIRCAEIYSCSTMPVDQFQRVVDEHRSFTVEVSRFTSLRHLDLQIHQFDGPVPEDQFPVINSIFDPLFQLQGLEKLVYPGEVVWGAQFAERVVEVWAGIRSLSMPKAIGPLPTFELLHLFAQHCPQLESLTIPVDFHKVPLALSDVEPTNHRLRNFICPSPITDSVLVARHLDRVFPFLEMARGNGPEWQRVMTLIRVICQPLRREAETLRLR